MIQTQGFSSSPSGKRTVGAHCPKSQHGLSLEPCMGPVGGASRDHNRAAPSRWPCTQENSKGEKVIFGHICVNSVDKRERADIAARTEHVRLAKRSYSSTYLLCLCLGLDGTSKHMHITCDPTGHRTCCLFLTRLLVAEMKVSLRAGGERRRTEP